MFSFERIVDRPTTGTFELDASMRRRLFEALGDELCTFGLRYIDEHGEGQGIGFVDPRRQAFMDICARIGAGRAEITALRESLPDGCGWAVNSPELMDGDDPFQTISDLFLAGLQLGEGRYPEKIYTTMYLGSYETGFGMHVDHGEDTALFVLDGTKHFVVEDGGVPVNYVIEANRYLAWRSGQRHSASNASREWSFTLNFAVGSPGVEGPVNYAFPKTERIFSYKQ